MIAPDLLEQLVDALADKLAPLVAAELAARLEFSTPATNGSNMLRLISLEELIAQLPAAKKPETWRRWLYERLRLGEVPGAVKLGGSWFLDAEKAQTWIIAGAESSRRTGV